jgi:hypothetical protein
MTLPEIVVFWDINFGGESLRTNLSSSYVGNHWNDEISSIIVVSGTWEFYEHSNFGGAVSKRLTPGYYSWVENSNVNIANDSISSFRCVDRNPV